MGTQAIDHHRDSSPGLRICIGASLGQGNRGLLGADHLFARDSDRAAPATGWVANAKLISLKENGEKRAKPKGALLRLHVSSLSFCARSA